jgi:protein TonB
MFEGSLVESQVHVANPSARWTAIGSMTVQCAMVGLLIAVPLLRPEALPMLRDAPRLIVPLAPKQPPPPVRVEPSAPSAATSFSAPAPSAAPMAEPRIDFTRLTTGPDDPAQFTATMLNMGPSGLPGALVGGSDTGSPRISVASATKSGKPLTVSSGVTAGMLIAPIQPLYPRIAVAAGIQGTVVMEALISKAGRIESLRVVSGPLMLQTAAVDAVRGAHYRPYLLNGEPTEVQTTISVNFVLGS